MQMKKWLKSENASMTVYVVVAIFSFMIILTSVFLAASAVRKNQLQTIPKIKEAYEKNLSNIQEIYDEREEQEGYIKDGLILHLDAINNTGSGHSNTTTTWKDLSGNGNDGTLYNIENSSTSGWQEDGLRLDGIDDYVSLDPAKLTNLQQGTVIVDFELYDWNPDQQYDTIFFKGNETNWVYNHIQISENLYSASNINTTISNNTQSTTASLLIPVSLNTYKQVALRWDGNQISNLDNGVLNQSITSALYPADDSTVCYLGRGYNEERYCNCKIKSLKIYNRALTDEEIAHNYRIDKTKYAN